MKLTIGLVFGFGMVWGQVPMKALNPRVEKIVAEVSAERIGGGGQDRRRGEVRFCYALGPVG